MHTERSEIADDEIGQRYRVVCFKEIVGWLRDRYWVPYLKEPNHYGLVLRESARYPQS